MVVAAVCCLIASGAKPSREVSHMQVKHGESQDFNSEMDLRREGTENTCSRRWIPVVHACLCLWEDNKITAEASRSFQPKVLCHIWVPIT